ncbi:histidine phosphatase superfamily [Cyathus striatus]|nr:histidine phosphatase superfamily [Cyathus striatus]
MVSRTYQTVSGFFVHDRDDSTILIPAVPARFGLIDETPERWANFRSRLSALNEAAPSGISYKAFIFARHGQGFHNVAEAKYGTLAWDEYWSKLNGDGDLVWGPDPKLTEVGEGQAALIRQGWETELAFDIPLPDKLYCSPFSRALKTCEIQFEGIIPFRSDSQRTVTVLENCREENGVHTCDRRSSRSYITETFPHFRIEDGLTEEDELWHPDIRETKSQIAERAKNVLDSIFDTEASAQFISITGHGGIINGFLTAVGRKVYTLPTGGVLPIVIECRAT